MNDDNDFCSDIRITINKEYSDELIEVVKCGTKEWMRIMSEMILECMGSIDGDCEVYCDDEERINCPILNEFIRKTQDGMI